NRLAPTASVGIPDFMRGPGQPVQVPVSGSGLPVQLSDGAGVTAVDFALHLDTSLLTVSGAVPAAGTTLSITQTSAGTFAVSFRSPTALAAGPVTLGNLIASVPRAAPYGATQTITLTDLLVNNDPTAATPVNSQEVVGYLGDTSGDGSYTGLDASLVARVAV